MTPLRHLRTFGSATLAGLAVWGAVVLLAPDRDRPEPPGPGAAPSATAPAGARSDAGTPRPPDAQPALSAAAAGGTATPPGISAAQWAALRAEMAQRPDGPAELSRLAAYFGFADAAQRFRQLRAAGASPERTALASQLDNALPERLRQRELSVAEALQLKAAILDVQVADTGERAQRLQQWRQSLPGSVLPVAPPDARQADFLRQQDALVAAWSAQPAAQRDARRLEQQLDALRRSSFPAPTP